MVSWCLRVLSHLSVCFGTWCILSLGSVRLGVCEHSNNTWIYTKTIAPRPPELQTNSGAVRLRCESNLTQRSNKQTNQTIYIHNDKYVNQPNLVSWSLSLAKPVMPVCIDGFKEFWGICQLVWLKLNQVKPINILRLVCQKVIIFNILN